MSKKSAVRNARNALVELEALGSQTISTFDRRMQELYANAELGGDIIAHAIGNCDMTINAIRKHRRKLVRARYEFKKEETHE